MQRTPKQPKSWLPKCSASRVLNALTDYSLNLQEGLLWLPRHERKLVLRWRLKKLRSTKQSADAIQSLQQSQATLQRSLVTAQAKLAAAEKSSPTCAQWAKEAVQCATQ